MSENNSNEIFFPNPRWRYSSKTAKFFIFDYKLFLLVFAFLFMINLYTIGMIFILFIIFWLIEVKYNYTFATVLRRSRVLIAGKYKPSVSPRRRIKNY